MSTKKLIIHKIVPIILLIYSFVYHSEPLSFANEMLSSTAPRFPNLTFKGPVSKETRQYLGLPNKNRFSLTNMKGEMFIIEVFNTYCTICPQNVPVLNNVYSSIAKDPALSGKIKVFGIAIGNSIKEVELYNKENGILYPVFTDYDFVNHKAIGSPRVPYTIFVKRNVDNKNILIYTHQGIFENSQNVIIKIKEFVQNNPTKSK